MANVPFLEKEAIWARADSFRGEYLPRGGIPVDVLGIVEFGLRVDIIPLHDLKAEHDIDALFLKDWTALIVDLRVFDDDRCENRLRYSIAHELGHFVLHKETHRDAQFQSVDDWAEYIQEVSGYDYSRIEFQAYEFAGRLLVPRGHLDTHLREAVAKAKEAGLTGRDLNSDAARDYVASNICRPFQVSAEVMAKRLVNEGIWPPSE